MTAFFNNPLVWLVTSLILLAACTFLPLRIKNDDVRFFVMRWVLVPVSIVIIAYSYPFGIEVFRRMAVNF